MKEHEQQRKGDVYREIKVGAVFAAQKGRERSKLAPGVFVDTPGLIQYVARRTTTERYGPLLYTLAQKCGIERARQVVVLADGAPWIWKLASAQFSHAIQIVDEWHTLQHVWKVAHAAFGQGTDQAAGWATTINADLAEGKIEEVIQAVERLPPLPPEPGKELSVPEIEANYFRTNAERMRYPTFRVQGMHLGSGVAEAACKTVVSTRAKRSGMRWTPGGLDTILALRTSVLNHTFDQRWTRRRQKVA